MDMKRFFLYAIVITALALAGCGGGGGGTSLMVDGERATQALIDALQGRANTAEGQATAANMTLGAIRTALGLMADADQAEIEGAITKLQNANPEDPVIAQLRTQLELAADATPAMIMDAIDELQGMEMATPDSEDMIAAAKAPAIADPDGDGMTGENNATDEEEANDDLTNPMRPGKMTGTADDFSASAGGIGMPAILAFGAAGTAAEYDRLGMPDAGIDDDDEFVMTSEGMVDGFARNKHTRTVEEVTTDTVTVFDNRDDPKDVAYMTFYSTTAAGDRDAVTSANAAGVLTLDGTDVATHHALFSASAFPSARNQTFTYADDDPDTDADEEMNGGRDFKGTFNGVPGTFACTTDSCTAVTNSNSQLTSLTGTWTFTPNAVAEDADPHMIRRINFDADYLAFGYWLQGTTVRGKTTYKIGTFATGSMPFAGGAAGTAVAALMGSATYSGPAAGMFVMKTDIDGDNKGPVPTSAGKFTADTSLTANFGATTMSATDFSISGTVDNFQLTNHDGSSVDNDWSLNLNIARFATPAFSVSTGNVESFSSHGREFNGTTGPMGSLGRWEGQFYGAQVTDNDQTATVNEAASGYPTGVAGEFIGHFTTGHAIGAFGAELDP